MDAPFIYDQAVQGDYFVGHQQVIQTLVTNFAERRHTLVQAPAGWGKTSVVKESLAQLSKTNPGLLPCWIDCRPFRSEQSFYQVLIQQVAHILAKEEPWHQLATKYLQEGSIPFSFRSKGDSFVLELFDLDRHYAEILDLPSRMAEDQSRPMVVCLDNFETLSYTQDPPVLAQRLRSVWQHHSQITYCFMARPRDFLQGLFETRVASFHSFGHIVTLPQIEASLLADFVQQRFAATGKVIAEKEALGIVSHMKSHPYYVQQLANTVWLLTEHKVLGTTIIRALEMMLGRLSVFFEVRVDELSNGQFNFLKALASGIESRFTRQQVINQFGFGSSANVVKIQRALVKKEMILTSESGVQFLDPAFALWFKWNILK